MNWTSKAWGPLGDQRELLGAGLLETDGACGLPEIAEGLVGDRDPPVAAFVRAGDLGQLVGQLEEVRDRASGHRIILASGARTTLSTGGCGACSGSTSRQGGSWRSLVGARATSVWLGRVDAQAAV